MVQNAVSTVSSWEGGSIKNSCSSYTHFCYKLFQVACRPLSRYRDDDTKVLVEVERR